MTNYNNTAIWSIKTFCLGIYILSTAAITQTSFAAPPQFLIAGTGGATGVYYPTGAAICRVINKSRKQTNVRCSAESTQGSVANLNAMADGELDLAIAQSDSQYHAYNGSDIFEQVGPNRNLRSVLALHAEPFTVVASKASGIKHFDDLAGKRVNIGNPGSGQRETMELLMQAKGWTKGSFALATELNSVDQPKALCDEKIDAFVFSAGHPAGSLKEAANTCDVVIVTVDGFEVEKLIAENSFYTKAVVPGGMYKGSEQDVETFGVSASLMASSTTDKELIYLVVKSVIENLDSMKNMHPAFTDLNPESMAINNTEIPMHEGASKYFMEAGLNKEYLASQRYRSNYSY